VEAEVAVVRPAAPRKGSAWGARRCLRLRLRLHLHLRRVYSFAAAAGLRPLHTKTRLKVPPFPE
jgi:hypothetical protein